MPARPYPHSGSADNSSFQTVTEPSSAPPKKVVVGGYELLPAGMNF